MKKSLIFVSNKPLNRVYSGKSACLSLQIKYPKSNLQVNLFSLLSLSTSTGEAGAAKEMGAGGLWPRHQAGNKSSYCGNDGVAELI